MAKQKTPFRSIPSVNDILEDHSLAKATSGLDRNFVKYCVRRTLDEARKQLAVGDADTSPKTLVSKTLCHIKAISARSLKPVINATGVVLHTNLGRAPLGQAVIKEIVEVCGGYSSLEFDLSAGMRGNRMSHVREVLKFLTSAEDVLVVNNNAAGIMLALHALARNREVIVSRGELIEIGDSFRVPDIMAASGAKMVEVGTTNRTRLSDYESAITSKTRLLFKAHRSNFVMRGFTHEPSISDLAALAHSRGLHLVYDLGSGLLRKFPGIELTEPDVPESVKDGADLVAFSCDKLMGGPQAGVVAGSAKLISTMARSPLMRALRVGKLTTAALSAVCRDYLSPQRCGTQNPTMAMMTRSKADIRNSANRTAESLKAAGIEARIVESQAQCGGGSLPEVFMQSHAVEILLDGKRAGKLRCTPAERIHKRLLESEQPVLSILREGRLLLDMLTVSDTEAPVLIASVAAAVAAESVA